MCEIVNFLLNLIFKTKILLIFFLLKLVIYLCFCRTISNICHHCHHVSQAVGWHNHIGERIHFLHLSYKIFSQAKMEIFLGINVTNCEDRTGPLVCLSPFAVISVDNGHQNVFHTSSDELRGGNKRECSFSYLALFGVKERERFYIHLLD